MDSLSIETLISLPLTHLITLKRPKEIMNHVQESTWFYNNNNSNNNNNNNKFIE